MLCRICVKWSGHPACLRADLPIDGGPTGLKRVGAAVVFHNASTDAGLRTHRSEHCRMILLVVPQLRCLRHVVASPQLRSKCGDASPEARCRTARLLRPQQKAHGAFVARGVQTPWAPLVLTSMRGHAGCAHQGLTERASVIEHGTLSRAVMTVLGGGGAVRPPSQMAQYSEPMIRRPVRQCPKWSWRASDTLWTDHPELKSTEIVLQAVRVTIKISTSRAPWAVSGTGCSAKLLGTLKAGARSAGAAEENSQGRGCGTQSTHVWLLRRVIYVGTTHVNADIPRICVVHQSRHRMRKSQVRRLPPAQTHSVTETITKMLAMQHNKCSKTAETPTRNTDARCVKKQGTMDATQSPQGFAFLVLRTKSKTKFALHCVQVRIDDFFREPPVEAHKRDMWTTRAAPSIAQSRPS